MSFLFITGVSQFAKVSIFSALNHLEQLSMSPNAATICGYTQQELEYAFADHIEQAQVKFGYTREQLLTQLKHWYNGYCFVKPNRNPTRLYNPFSIINFFKALDFQNYWFISGTPTFVIEFFKHHHFSVTNFEQVLASENDLSALMPSTLETKTLLYQTGYLTIKHFDAENYIYELGFPNFEVAKSCMDQLFKSVLELEPTTMQRFGTELRNLFASKTFTDEALTDILWRICSQIPCWIAPKIERNYQMLFWMVLEMSGLEVCIEDATSLGRIDATVVVNNQAFIIEMKTSGTADEALAQITKRKYADKYTARGLSITTIGIVFDTKNRTVGECKIV